MPFPVPSVRGYACLVAANSSLTYCQQRKLRISYKPQRSLPPGRAAPPTGPQTFGAVADDAAATTHGSQQQWNNLTWRFEGANGDVVVQPLTAEMLEETALLLVETYFNTYNLGPYKRYLLHQIRRYLTDHMKLVPKTLLLVACMHPSGAAAAEGENLQSSAGQNTRLPASQVVGTAEISFDDNLRSVAQTLLPPENCAFITNMAVAPSSRRQGIATKLLHAACSTASIAGHSEVYLHVRVQDKPARELYKKNGFVVAQEDSWLVCLLGRDRKQMLRKHIADDASR